jgi:hypothetical protein
MISPGLREIGRGSSSSRADANFFSPAQFLDETQRTTKVTSHTTSDRNPTVPTPKAKSHAMLLFKL